jgi:hypothetical protein
VFRRTTLKRSPELERVEQKCLLNATMPAIAPVVAIAPPVLHPFHHARVASNNALMSVSTPLPSPVARVQVDNTGLVSGRMYTISALEVQNATSTAIRPGSFIVGVAGHSFTRSFPEQAWQPRQTIVFFAPVSFQNFAFKIPHAVPAIPSNTYYNVTYNSNPTTFAATLHSLIDSSRGVGGRFQLV